MKTNADRTARVDLRSAMTLMELLVVMAILSTVALFAIPTIRTVSKERSLREASRTVAAFFQEAQSRARQDGFAGVVIARNPNFYRFANATGDNIDAGGVVRNDGARVFYAGYTMYQMRRPLPFAGNGILDLAGFPSAPPLLPPLPPPPPNAPPAAFDFEIDKPFDVRVLIEPGCTVTFGNSPIRHEIVMVMEKPPAVPGNPVRLEIRCLLNPLVSLPPGLQSGGSGVQFRIERRPEVVVTSAVQLPKGYFINLNYSGMLDSNDADGSDLTWTDFSTARSVVPVIINGVPQNVELAAQPVVITFDRSGAIDLVYSHGLYAHAWDPAPPAWSRYRPLAPVSFCLSTDHQENTFALSSATPGFELPFSVGRAQRDLLNNTDVQWISIDHRNGRVSVSDTIQVLNPFVDPGAGNRTAYQAGRLLQSRGLAAEVRLAGD